MLYSKIKNWFEGFIDCHVNKMILDLKLAPTEFKLNITDKCLVFTARPLDEILGVGGLMASYTKNFEILCITDGAPEEKYLSRVETMVKRQKEFKNAMELLRPKGFKIFDIPEGELINNYNKFAKIDVSEIDYIFIPNIFTLSLDVKALVKHLATLLSKKERKQNLKIVLYEYNSAIAAPNFYFDITSKAQIKRELIENYPSQLKQKNWTEVIFGLNSFRAANLPAPAEGPTPPIKYAEAFCIIPAKNFLRLIRG